MTKHLNEHENQMADHDHEGHHSNYSYDEDEEYSSEMEETNFLTNRPQTGMSSVAGAAGGSQKSKNMVDVQKIDTKTDQIFFEFFSMYTKEQV